MPEYERVTVRRPYGREVTWVQRSPESQARVIALLEAQAIYHLIAQGCLIDPETPAVSKMLTGADLDATLTPDGMCMFVTEVMAVNPDRSPEQE